MTGQPLQPREATIGVITALPHEYVAACEILGCEPETVVKGKGAGRRYALARVPSRFGGAHIVAVALQPQMGNTSAAVRATLMVEHCPSMEHIIMCGIAGGVPCPEEPAKHVRLGDIVVSGDGGVVAYGYGEETTNGFHVRVRPRAPAAELQEAVNGLKVDELQNDRGWEKAVVDFLSRRGVDWQKPPDGVDRLEDGLDVVGVIHHPCDPVRTNLRGMPRVFHGPIASADSLLKDPIKRNLLRDQHDIKAVEMEGHGIADATWTVAVGYLVVRGICDYCNPAKGDTWQKYAAVVAAAYCRSVIEAMPPSQRHPLQQGTPQAPVDVQGELVQLLRQANALTTAILAEKGRAPLLTGPENPHREAARIPMGVATGELVQDNVHTEPPQQLLAMRLDIENLLDVLEFDRAIAAASRLEVWVSVGDGQLPAEALAETYALLVRIALLEASRESESSRKTQHLNRARRFLERAMHACPK